ncbi:NnrS family protein [Salipiger sp. PrR007]|uniref:NnrS family protein n=1 Tax=Salipiger sp. PrR007 TaxID=2706884 RepID=UPI0021061250|nr:NnrS family protein [Salipiger sp. PrR007]
MAGGQAGHGVSALLPAGLGASVDVSFLLVLALVMHREIVAGRNWHNLGVVALLGIFLGGNVLFHVEARGGVRGRRHGAKDRA